MRGLMLGAWLCQVKAKPSEGKMAEAQAEPPKPERESDKQVSFPQHILCWLLLPHFAVCLMGCVSMACNHSVGVWQKKSK